jgi:hypothetical protein
VNDDFPADDGNTSE